MKLAKVILVALASITSPVVACSGYGGGGDARITPIGGGEGETDGSAGDGGGRQNSGDSGTAREDLSAGLFASYRFDGDTTDSSGAGRDLTIVGPNGSQATYPLGVAGRAVRLPDEPVHLALPSNEPAIDFEDRDFTLQAWVKLERVVATSETVLLGKFTSSSGWRLSLRGDNGVEFRAPPSIDFTTSRTVTAGAWHHVVARRRASSFDVFFDGTSDGSVSRGNAAITSADEASLVIGQASTALPSRPGARLLDEVAIWTRALSDGEIAKLYNQGVGGSVTGSNAEQK